MAKKKESGNLPAVKKTTVPKKQSTEIVNMADSFIKMAIDRNLDVEKLEKLIQLKNSEEDRLSKKLFNEQFALMQKELPIITKSKAGYDYNYAPLELLQSECNDIITKWGFSYRFAEAELEGNKKRVILIINGYGHENRDTYFDVPQLTGTSRMNAVQIAGAMSTYGMRNAFRSGFGIIIKDEDNDCSFDDGIEYAEQIKLLRESESIEELQGNWAMIWKWLKDDAKGKKILTVEYNKQKEKLTK